MRYLQHVIPSDAPRPLSSLSQSLISIFVTSQLGSHKRERVRGTEHRRDVDGAGMEGTLVEMGFRAEPRNRFLSRQKLRAALNRLVRSVGVFAVGGRRVGGEIWWLRSHWLCRYGALLRGLGPLARQVFVCGSLTGELSPARWSSHAARAGMVAKRVAGLDCAAEPGGLWGVLGRAAAASRTKKLRAALSRLSRSSWFAGSVSAVVEARARRLPARRVALRVRVGERVTPVYVRL